MRKKLDENAVQVQDLDELVDSYGKQNDELNSLKKEVDKQKLVIKDLLKKGPRNAEGKCVHSGSSYTVTLSFEDNSTLNEEKLIEVLKKKLSKTKLKNLGIIKTREYIDEQAIMDAIYTKEIDAEILLDLDSCKEPSIKEVLRMSKKKEETSNGKRKI